MVRNHKVSTFIKLRLDVIIVVILVIMQKTTRNHLTRIGIGRNIMPQLLQKRNNLNQISQGVTPRTQIKKKNISWL